MRNRQGVLKKYVIDTYVHMCVCTYVRMHVVVCHRVCMRARVRCMSTGHAVCVHGELCTCRIGTLQFNKFEETLVSAGLEVAPV